MTTCNKCEHYRIISYDPVINTIYGECDMKGKYSIYDGDKKVTCEFAKEKDLQRLSSSIVKEN